MSKPLFFEGEEEFNIVKVTTVTTAIISTCYIMSVLFHHYKELKDHPKRPENAK
jgi:hypothetical protein